MLTVVVESESEGQEAASSEGEARLDRCSVRMKNRMAIGELRLAGTNIEAIQELRDHINNCVDVNKLQALSLDSNIVEWIRQWLSDRQQRVVVNGVYSAQGLVTSGVPQGSVLGPILFNIFISDIAEGINGKVCLFADDTKICNRVDVPGGISQMTNDLGKLKKWSELWQLSFNVDKCKIMHLGRKNPRAEYRIFDTVLTSTSEERDLGVIISEDLKGK
uniref:Reverse transcriptase domain-containing protein n=1 Tax=Leptobrachium leishanense TaxID=445787 RepID=A0A8C5LLW9_9ANUR